MTDTYQSRAVRAIQVPENMDGTKAAKDVEEELRKVAAWLDDLGAHSIELDVKYDAPYPIQWQYGTMTYGVFGTYWILYDGDRFYMVQDSMFRTLFERSVA